MTTLNLAGYPYRPGAYIEIHAPRVELPESLSAFLGRMGSWTQTPPGRVAQEQLWPALGGGNTDPNWRPASSTVDIDVSHLTRKELSSFVRILDVFARSHPGTGMIRQLIDAIIAEDAAAQTDPHAPRLIDA